MVLVIVVAGVISTPSSSTVHWLRATRGRALLIVVVIRASITTVSSVGAVHIVSAPPVLVVRSIVLASTVRTPSSSAVNRLRATRIRALLVIVGVWATVSIVSSALAVHVVPAALVLVIGSIMLTIVISTPSSSTVHWLSTSTSRARDLIVAVRALLAIGCRFSGHLVSLAALVLVARSNMLTNAIRSPLTLTVNRLAASRLGAMLLSILVHAIVTIVLGILGNHKAAAPLVLMILLIVEAGFISTPSSNTVHRLGTTRLGALLVLVAVWASITIVSSVGAVHVLSAPVVLVV